MDFLAAYSTSSGRNLVLRKCRAASHPLRPAVWVTVLERCSTCCYRLLQGLARTSINRTTAIMEYGKNATSYQNFCVPVPEVEGERNELMLQLLHLQRRVRL